MTAEAEPHFDVIEQTLAECPYHFDDELRRRLREQYPDSVRQIWVCDGPEVSPDPDPLALRHDAVTALMVVGYETLRDYPILPSSVFLHAAKDIRVYSVGRYIKDSEDAGEYLLTRDKRPHINEFLSQMIGLVEDLHARGLHMNAFIAAIDEELEHMYEVARQIGSQLGETVSNSQLCTLTWQALLSERMPPVTVAEEELASPDTLAP